MCDSANIGRKLQPNGSLEQRGWSERYREKHRLVRVTPSSAGNISLPKTVRIYRRTDHHVLQWWEPANKKTLSLKVTGDLIDAVAKGREIESRLTNFRSSGNAHGRLSHSELVSAYLKDLESRANAGEIDLGTVARYRAPLECHYLVFVAKPEVARRYSSVTRVDRNFQLEFLQFLQSRNVSANGRVAGTGRPMRGQRYVIDTVRAMFHWAADSQRGNLLPTGFVNPFRRRAAEQRRVQELLQPDVTMEMTAEFILKCDLFQLPIFSVLALYGLRPGELGWLFGEDMSDGWFRVAGIPELSYSTKGKRDKQFPMLECLRRFWEPRSAGLRDGLMFHARKKALRKLPMPSKESLTMQFQEQRSHAETAAKLRTLRNRLLASAGQLTYDPIRLEFGKLARRLSWPRVATVKDFRHLFATSLENAGVPESYRRFFMGHAPGREAIVNYTHLNRIREHFLNAIEREYKPVVAAIEQRSIELGMLAGEDT